MDKYISIMLDCNSYGVMQSCWQDNPKSRCTFEQVANELQDLLAKDCDYSLAPGASADERVQTEAQDHCDDSYLVPMQMETAFGAEGPCTDQGNQADYLKPTQQGSDYVNKSVIR